jgi:hypothetical protein
MIRKLIISFNWVVGTFALIAALSSGFLQDVRGVSAHMLAIEHQVEEIARLQNGKKDLGGYVPFSRNVDQMKKRLGSAIGTTDYQFEAFFEEDGAGGQNFVIRAMTAEQAIKDGRVPPLIYKYVFPGDGSEPRKKWVTLSSKSYGLNLF